MRNRSFEMLRALDVGGVSSECFSSDDELLQQLEGILPKALANSETRDAGIAS